MDKYRRESVLRSASAAARYNMRVGGLAPGVQDYEEDFFLEEKIVPKT